MSQLSERPMWQDTYVQIATSHGPRSVAAEVYGPFAVHTMSAQALGFGITHVPTGRLVFSNLGRDTAKLAAVTLVRAGDWSEVRSEEDIPKPLMDVTRDIRAALFGAP